MAREHLSDAQLGEIYEQHAGLVTPRAQRAYGTNSIYGLFSKQGENPLFERYGKPAAIQRGVDPEEYRYSIADKDLIPWERATMGTRSRPIPYEKGLVHAELERPIRSANVREFDPRHVLGSQPSIVAHITRHYLEGGRNAPIHSDQENVGNQMPFVYVHRNTGELRLLTGHHRASAALLRGEPLVARYTIGE